MPMPAPKATGERVATELGWRGDKRLSRALIRCNLNYAPADGRGLAFMKKPGGRNGPLS